MTLYEELLVTTSVTDDGTMKTAKSIQKTEPACHGVTVCVCGFQTLSSLENRGCKHRLQLRSSEAPHSELIIYYWFLDS